MKFFNNLPAKRRELTVERPLTPKGEQGKSQKLELLQTILDDFYRKHKNEFITN
jgi:hypothetical protein